MNKNEIKNLFPNNHDKFMDLTSAKYIYDLFKKMPKVGRLVETGTGKGDSTYFFALAKPKWTIYTIDGYGLFGEIRYPYGDTFSVHDYLKNQGRFEELNVIQIIQDSKKVHWELPVNVIYIDGDHTYDGCMADFNRYSPFLVKDGYILFDDYKREDLGVKKAVDEICLGNWELFHIDKIAYVRRKL